VGSHDRGACLGHPGHWHTGRGLLEEERKPGIECLQYYSPILIVSYYSFYVHEQIIKLIKKKMYHSRFI